MIIIPAIDLRDGKCVRLIQGDYSKETIYFDDPAEVAKRWKTGGAERIHLVDLDGALKGSSINFKTIEKIRASVDCALELGGGIRDMETVQKYFDLGIDKLILGSVAVKNPEFVKEVCEKFKDKIIVGIDARDGKVATQGWTEVSQVSHIEFAKKMEELGVAEFIFTDISRDGMLEGVNITAVKEFAQSIKVNMIVSGGVASLKDIENVQVLGVSNISGIIIGKALYTDQFTLEEAIEKLK
ncbi:1-(5-phosphoribosyl)-5-[(5-phosphoribosylamino)methylideneamino]imidazole-4-carboxamide isomerase [bacterium]